MGDYNTLKKSPGEFLTDWGISFVERGNELQTACLLSDCDKENTASTGHLYISAETGQYKCHKCQASGNLVTLAERLGIDVKTLFSNRGEIKHSAASPEPPTEDKVESVLSISMSQLQEWNTKLSPEHRSYLNKRGLSDAIINQALIGEVEKDGCGWLTIPALGIDGNVKVVKLGRFPEDEEVNPIKYRYYAKGSESTLFGIETLQKANTDYCIITEGELDCLILRDWGFTAVSSTSGAGTFPPDWISYFNDFSKIYFCYDNDKAGKESVLEHLPKFTNKDVYVVDVPNLESVKDITDFKVVAGKSKEDFEKLLSTAKKYDPNRYEFKKLQFASTRKEFIPSQYFENDKAALTLPVLANSDNKKSPEMLVITSDKYLYPLQEYLQKFNFVCTRHPAFTLNWSKEGIEAFLTKNEEYDYYDILDKTVSHIRKYVDFEDFRWYLVLGLWIWGTYFHRFFNAYPYINVNGLMSSGKSKLLEVCSLLAFNGKFLMGSTPAYVIREIHENNSTIFLDEVEQLKKPSTPDAQTLLLMLNSGYKKGPRVGKMDSKGDGGKWLSKEYDPYSAKMIAGISNISDTLISRSITVTMLASNNPAIRNNEVVVDDPAIMFLKDAYYCSVLSLVGKLHTSLQNISDTELHGRNWEVWRPLLVLAKAIDAASLKENEPIYNTVRNFAIERVKILSTVSEESQSAIQLLVALKQMMEEDNKTEAFYPIPNLKTYLTTFHEDEFAWLKTDTGGVGKYLGTTLRKSGVIQEGSKTKWIEGKVYRGYELNLNIIRARLSGLGVST